MAIYVPREKLYLNTVTIPATKTAAAVTLTSDVISDFKDESLASVDLELAAVNPSKITDNITVQPWVSYNAGTTWIKPVAAYTDIISSGGTAEVVGSVMTATTRTAYSGKWFVIYDGATPYVVWIDETGSATIPAGIAAAGFTNAVAYKINISGASDTVDSIGAAFETAFDIAATGVFGSTYTAGTDTLTISPSYKHACNAPNSGNWLATTAVASSFGTTTQGADLIALKNLGVAQSFKVDVIFDGSAALASGHGVRVSTKMKELDPLPTFRKKIYANCVTMPATAAASTYVEAQSAVMYSDGLDPIKKVYMITNTPDCSKITNTVNAIVETSDDNVVWRAGSAVVTTLANGSGIVHTVTEVTNGSTYFLGKYVRVRLYAAAAATALTSGHGITCNVILGY
jgi:hypothetical protein